MATLVCARCGSPELDFQLAARVCDACAGQPWHDAVGPDACGAVRALHQRCQTQGIGPEAGQLLVEVLRFARTLMMAKGEVVLEPTQTEEVIDIVENLLDAAGESTLSRRLAPATNRSSDGILQADTGVFRFFDGGTIPPLENALRDIPAEFWGAQQHWMCPRCKRPTSDDYLEHMQLRHPGMSSIQVPPASLTAEDVARCLEERSSMAPACMLYTMETPLYRASNKAMREWGVSPEAFAPFQGFAMRLDSELKGMEEYVGYAYRAVDCSMPNGLYDKGAVVTWNQPSSASTSPRVAKLFMQGGGLDLRGTLFIIRSLTARPIAKFSVHPEEAEVLFRAGTQFLVQSRADLGVKGLLEVVMRCSLQQVDVYELVELRLRRWADVLQYLDPSDALRNTELVNLIRKIESTPRHHLHSAPLSTLIHREHDKATAVHLAAAVPQNATCLRLVAAALGPADFAVRDALGRTALHVAVDSGHSEAALFLLHRGAPLDLLTGSQLLKAAPWVGQHGRDELLFQLRDLLRSDEQFRQLVHQQPTAMHPGLRVVCEYRSAAIVEQMLIRELTGHQFSGLALAAARRANFPVVALLLTRQADPNAADDAGMSLLQHAAAAGPLSLLETLLQLGADVHHTDHDGQTALMHATSQSRVDAAQLLLGAGAAVGPISAHSTGGVTALALAAERGCLELVEVLLAAGASQELSTAQSWTPLMMAAKGGRLAILQTLLAAGGDANAAGFGGRAPLYFAAEAGHVAGVQALLAAGADANARGADGRTALMAAAQQEHMAALEVLLRARACVALGDRGGTTALMHAARSGAAAAVAMLLQAKADVNARYGAAPALVYACESGHVPAVKALLQAEADVAMATPTGTTALTVAYQYGHGAVIDLLRSTGADLVPLHGPGGRQALAFACRSGAVTSVERMLAANVDVNAPDAAGRTPLMHAAGGDVEAAAHPLAAPTSVADGGHLRVLDLLLDGGADVDAEDAEGRTALAHAAIEGHTALVQRLLRAKADAHSVDHEGHTPMMHAAREGHVNVIEALLEAGADVDYTRQRPTVSFLPSRAEGWTALMSAAQGGRLEAAKRLLRARADLWAVNVDDGSPKWDGFTAVAVAVHGGHRGLVQLLVEKFANVNPPPGKEHAAPLLLACEHGDRPIVDMLLAAGARRWMQDAAGNTPLIVAARNGHTAVVRALLTSAEASPSPRFAGMMARLLDMLHLPQSLGSAAREGEDLDLIQAVNERDSQGWPALLHAAANGHHAVLALLVEARADVNAGRDWSALSRLTTASGAGQTALHVCCRQGMVDSVVLLLAAKAAPDARDEDQQTPLMHAAHRAGNGAILTALLQVRADVDARDDTGCSAILYAAARGKVDAVAVLVEAKANVNLADKKDRSALMAAAEAGHADAARLLVAARANASAADSNAQTALTLAVRRRHLPVVRALLDAGASESALPAPRWIEAFAHPNPAQAVAALVHSGADVNAADAEGRTPLQLACECHAPDAIQALLGAHADGTAALLRAAADSHAATARQLLEGRVDVDGRNADGQTALMLACLGAHHTALEVLLQHRADIHLSDHGRRTALLIAARDANVQALQLLVHARAAVNAVDMRGRTPLMLAADSEHACGAAAEVLLGAKADVNVAGQGGKTALIFAAGRGHCDVTLALLRAAADVNSATAQGLTALIYAAGNGHAAAAALLLAARADAGRPDHARRTALMYAAKAGSAPAVQALLAAPAGRFSSSPEDAKALVQATDRDGLTALHHACKRGHPHVAELLIAAGADHLASTANGLTALALACKEGHAPVAQLLLRASSAPLEEAPPGGGDGALQPQEGSPRQCLECSDPLSDAWDGAVTYFADLFRLDHPPMPGAVAGLKGRFVANVNSADAQGWTALHHAASMGYLELLRALLAADADVHAVTDAGDTPLARAAVQGHGEAARLLLRARADVNARNKAGATVLIAVCHCSREGADVAQLLLDAGAHVNVADQLGTTALMSAAQHNHRRVLRLLLKKDALVDVRDHDQKTALFYASAMGYTEVLEMLLDTKADPQLATVDGHTPLTAAVSGGHAVEVARLLAAKADPNAITDDGWTALGITAYNANLGIAEVLLAHRADLELHLTDAGDPGDPVWPPSEDPRTAATPKGRSVPCATPSSVLSPQLEYSQRSLLTPMSPETVIGLRSPKVQSVPWAFRPDLQPRSMTPLMIACRAGHLDVVEFLLARQAQVDALGGSRSALMHAAAAGHLGVLAALLRAGAAVNAADAHGATALTCAVLSSSEEAVGCLLEAQADVHAVCTLPTLGPGLPIVAVAAAQGSVPILELLLEADADPSATAADGRTALAIAAQSGHTDLVKRLWRRRRQASVANLSLSQEPDSNSQSGRPSSFPLPLCPTSQTSD